MNKVLIIPQCEQLVYVYDKYRIDSKTNLEVMNKILYIVEELTYDGTISLNSIDLEDLVVLTNTTTLLDKELSNELIELYYTVIIYLLSFMFLLDTYSGIKYISYMDNTKIVIEITDISTI